MKGNKRIGLALSGGGYRAAAFHLGVLRTLNKLNLLDKVDVISTISGGSIIGAYYCINDKKYEEFESEFYSILNSKSVIKYIVTSWRFILAILLFCVYIFGSYYCMSRLSNWAFVPLLLLFIYLTLKYQYRILPLNKIIEAAYNKFLYKHASLSMLKEKPILAIGSTNLQTFRPFTFSKAKMDDSLYAYAKDPIRFKNTDFPIARAVAASTCVPIFFTPVEIDKIYFENPNDYNKIKPVLVDGGIYDNQGIQKLTQAKSSYECDIIITSDAGNKLPFQGQYSNTFTLLLRTIEAFMARIKNFQMVQNIYNPISRNKEVAYFSLGWEIQNCIPGFISNLKNGNIPASVINAHNIPATYLDDVLSHTKEITEILAKNINYATIFEKELTKEELKVANSVNTNLTSLSTQKIDCLMKQATNLTELQLRLYCPILFS